MNNIFKDPHKVWKITTLKNKIRQDEAKQILAKVAKLVQPIMRRHNWRVKLLAEYCPKDPSIRGENVGGERLEIHLRIRRPNSEMDFFAFDQILDNMLHELCHYNRGPHDEKFYDLLDQVRRECNELLLDKGKGVRLNGNPRKSSLFSFIPSGPKHLGRNSTVMKPQRWRRREDCELIFGVVLILCPIQFNILMALSS